MQKQICVHWSIFLTISFSVKNSDSQTSLLNGVVAKDALAPTPPRSNNNFSFWFPNWFRLLKRWKILKQHTLFYLCDQSASDQFQFDKSSNAKRLNLPKKNFDGARLGIWGMHNDITLIKKCSHNKNSSTCTHEITLQN